MRDESPWAILGVPPGSSRETARQAWLALARTHHPDAGGDVKRMARINAAWAELAGGEWRQAERISAEQPAPVHTAGRLRELVKSACHIMAEGSAEGYQPEMVTGSRGWRAEGVPPWQIAVVFESPVMVELVSAEALPLPYPLKRAHHRAVEVHEIIIRLTDGSSQRFLVRMAVCADRDIALRFPDGAGPACSLEILTHEAILPPGWKNLRIHGRAVVA